MEFLAGFLYGVLGGFFAELLGHYRLRHQTKDQFPEWIRSPYYWIVTILMVLAGGGLVFIYLASGVPMKPIIAVNIGASAPLIIGRLTAQTPQAGKID